MGSATSVAVAAGPLVVLGYLLTATSVAYARHRAASEVTVIEGVAALTAITVGWHVTRAVAPGPSVSVVGFASVQVLLVWQSVALWTGAAAVVGAVAPLWSRFRGTSGLGAAIAILVVQAPAALAAGAAGFVAGLVASGGRPRTALAVGIVTPVAFEWVAWVTDLQVGWGVAHGPELALWTALVSGVLFARWLRGDILADGPPRPARDQ